MDFDVTKAYTALNADELKVGSKCIFADTAQDLRQKVQDDYGQDIVLELTEIRGDGDPERFTVGDTNYLLAYLIEPPKKPQYKPFSSVEKAKKVIDRHGGWIKEAASGYKYLVAAYKEDGIGLFDEFLSLQELDERFVFLDDGSPCGELMEE